MAENYWFASRVACSYPRGQTRSWLTHPRLTPRKKPMTPRREVHTRQLSTEMCSALSHHRPRPHRLRPKKRLRKLFWPASAQWAGTRRHFSKHSLLQNQGSLLRINITPFPKDSVMVTSK